LVLAEGERMMDLGMQHTHTHRGGWRGTMDVRMTKAKEKKTM
jgi:hypothetical protein